MYTKHLMVLTCCLVWGSMVWADNQDDKKVLGTLSEEPALEKPSETTDMQTSLRELCNSYAQEGTLVGKQESDISNCLTDLTDFKAPDPEPLPFLGEDNQATATPSAENANIPDPEALVKDEIVEKPDPHAEQLTIN